MAKEKSDLLEEQPTIETPAPVEKTVPQPAKEVKIPERLNKRIPDFYLFRLLRKIEYMQDGQSVHGGPFVLPAESEILWAYKTKDDGTDAPYGLDEKCPEGHDNFQVRRVRFIPNIQAIFVDEQKGVEERKDGQRHPLLDNNIIRDKLTFTRGELRIKSQEKNLFNFLRCSVQIKNMHPNARSLKNINPVFELIDFGYLDEQVIKKGQVKQQAYQLALTARNSDIIPHCKFLNIQLKDASGIDRDMEAVKTEYHDYALSNPDKFISSFSDPKIKVIYTLRILSEHNEILLDGSSAKWRSGSFISQIPIGKDPFDYLAELSLTDEGQEFSNNIRSVYNDLKARNKHNTTFI